MFDSKKDGHPIDVQLAFLSGLGQQGVRFVDASAVEQIAGRKRIHMFGIVPVETPDKTGIQMPESLHGALPVRSKPAGHTAVFRGCGQITDEKEHA